MKNLFLVICIIFSTHSFGQIIVELAAFNTEVDKDTYFRGFTNVYHVKDQSNINRYYVNAAANAEALVEQGKAIGLNPRIIDMAERKRKCSAICISYEELEKLKNIFFDFDQYYLRDESKRRLDLLHSILVDTPGYRVEFRAHTDAKGTLEYNETLADNRAAAARDYMLSRGVSSDRVTTTRFGERAPIAKNEINGQDAPDGRQLNRRVEIVVYGADGAIVNLVEAIYVPAHLQN